MAGPIKIAIVGDVRDFEKSTAKIDSALDKTATKSQKVGKVIDKAAAGAALAFAAAGAGALKLAQGAAEDEQAAAALAKTLQNTAGATKSQIAATEDWITAQGKALGVADDQLRPALSALATATGDVGEAQRLTALAMDVSAGSGKSLEAVTAALVRAQNGSVGGLSRLGIATKDASGKTKDFATLQDELAKKFGGQAATAADTMAGKMGRAKLALAEAGETIGYMLIPVLSSLGTWLNDKVVPAMDAAFGWMEDNQETVKAIGISVAALGAAFIAASIAMKIYAAGAVVVAAATKAWAAVQWLLNAAMSANPLTLLVIAIAAVAAALVVAYQKSETFRTIVDTAFQAIKTVITTVLEVVSGIIKTTFNAIKAVFTTTFNAYRTIVTTVFDGIKAYFTTTFGVYRTLFTTAWNAIKSVTSAAFAGIKNLIVEPMQGVVDFIASVPGKITALGSKFKAAGSAIMRKIIEGIKGAAGFIGNIASGIWDAVKGMINGAIDKINSALEFKISLPGPDININPPDIPHLARGGITTGPTLAVIGDNPGGREAVIPLDKYDLSGKNIANQLEKLIALVELQGRAQREDMITLTQATTRAPALFGQALSGTAAGAARRAF